MRNTTAISALIIALGMSCGLATAQESTAPVPSVSSVTPFLSGGVGDEELQHLQQASKRFNLKLLLTAKSGSYLADVMVTIFNSENKRVLEVPSAGPLLLAKLPAGVYRVSATYEGKELQKRVSVRAGGAQTLAFVW